jgi:hypothetical protein
MDYALNSRQLAKYFLFNLLKPVFTAPERRQRNKTAVDEYRFMHY